MRFTTYNVHFEIHENYKYKRIRLKIYKHLHLWVKQSERVQTL